MDLRILLIVFGVFGTILFLLISRYMVRGVNLYESKVMGDINRNMRDSFIFLDPKKLFVGTLILTSFMVLLLFFATNIIFAILGGAVCLFAPNFIVNFLRKKRLEQFIYQLPDCLNAVSASLRAGSNLSRAFEMAAIEQVPPMSQELAIVMSEYKIGRSFEDALKNLHKRIPMQEVELLNTAIAISSTVGGNLATTLDSLADTLREKAQIEGKIQALTAQGRMQAWLAMLLPIAVGYMIYKREPEAMSAMFTEPVGWAVSAVLICMMLLANYVIRKIVNIDV